MTDPRHDQPLTTDKQAKYAKADKKPYKWGAEHGLYLLVAPDGSKYWRFKYRYAGKEKLLGLGVYPETSLKEATTRRDRLRTMLREGLDPGAEKKAAKGALRLRVANTFQAVALEWYELRRSSWSKAHAEAVEDRLERDLFPTLGAIPVADIGAPKLLECLRKIEARDALVVASKARVIAGQVIRYAISTGRASVDPSRDLKGALKVREQNHYARLAESDLPEFFARLDAYDGSPVTKAAIRLLILTFVRTIELRGATWSEIDLGKREWRISAERMKGGIEHLVPLSEQALAALRELEALTGDGDFLFPNEHHAGKPMSENTILFALYRMGYRGKATGHGMRATASTILNEQKWRPDVVERQLAHRERNKIRAAYHHSEYLPERKKMMQAWADFLDAKRREGDKVVSITRKRA